MTLMLSTEDITNVIYWRYHLTFMLSDKTARDTNVIYWKHHVTLMQSNQIGHDIMSSTKDITWHLCYIIR